MPTIVGRFGKKRAYLAAGVVAVTAAIGFALAPSSVPIIGIACYGLLGLGLGAINTLIFALQADIVDYGEWKSGVRAEGASYSVLSFMRKAGQAVGGGASAYTIGLGGYVSGAAAQDDAAVTSIRIAAGIVPAVGWERCVRTSASRRRSNRKPLVARRGRLSDRTCSQVSCPLLNQDAGR